MCILLQSVSNEVFALLGGYSFDSCMGIFFELFMNKLNHHFTTTTTTEKEKERRELLFMRELLRLFLLYTQNLRQQTTDAQIVHDL